MLLARPVPIAEVRCGHACSIDKAAGVTAVGPLCTVPLQAGMELDSDLPGEQAGAGGLWDL